MRYDTNHKEVFATPDTVAGDLALIFEAVADAFRGLSHSPRLESRWSRLRHCGCSF